MSLRLMLTCPRCRQEGFTSGAALARHWCNGQNARGEGQRLELRRLTAEEIEQAVKRADGDLFPLEPREEQLGLL